MKFGKRLEFLETKFEELKVQNKTILLQIEAIAEQLDKSEKGVSRKPDGPEKPLENAGKLNLANPNDFKGDCLKRQVFLHSCELYIWLTPQQFLQVQLAIHWTLSFMKSGRASLFAQDALFSHSLDHLLPYSI